MPKSDASWNGSLRIVGDLERPDHHLLRQEDECYFMGSYTSGAGYAHSFTNNLINNLKKPMSKQGTPEWPHKRKAIRDAADALREGLQPGAIAVSAFIPVPPSCPKGHPNHDDRMTQIARRIAPTGDVRELLLTTVERPPRHTSTAPRDTAALRATIAVDDKLRVPRPKQVIMLDDVMTTGCGFRVCKDLIQEVWPGITVYGVFVARVARPPITFASTW
ncbi:hypothetical protein [Neotabrizicola sp. sgz301269]|uniref:hypothetical protein n=1 Tax=Neotabrizicola sp. sgz301269 TaxID=3276282 RepID=UPI003770566F